MKEQIEILEEQKKLHDKAKDALKNIYSTHETEKFRKEMESYIKLTKTSNVRYEERKRTEESLLNKFKNPGVDPNVIVTVTERSSVVERPFWQALTDLNMINKKEFFQVIQNKNTNITFHHRSIISSEEIMFSGIDILDDPGHRTALYLLTIQKNSQQYHYGREYSSERFRHYLKLAPPVDEIIDQQKRNPMHYAALQDDDALMIDLILAGFTKGKEKDSNGDTPWDLALRHGSAKVAKLLKQADLKTESRPADELQLRFCESIRKRNYPLIKECLNAGANPYQKWNNEMNALQNACVIGDERIVEILLLEKIDPNNIPALTGFVPVRNITDPLMIAVSKNRKKIFDMLIDKNANFSKQRENSYSPLWNNLAEFILYHFKNSKQLDNTVEYYLKRMIQHGWDINQKNFIKGTPLWFACNLNCNNIEFQKDLVRFLLKNGADPHNMPNPFYMRPVIRKIIDDAKNK